MNSFRNPIIELTAYYEGKYKGNNLIYTLTKSYQSNNNDDYERRNFGEHENSLKLGGYLDTITIEPGQKHDKYSSHQNFSVLW